MRIVDAHDQVLPPGACGEVVIRGPNVMLGYWNRPVETSHVLTQGWFHTGDIGYMDDHGYFYIVDRVKDMINVGGAKVYPSEIEQLLVQHPAVAEAAVYGVPHALLGEQVRASLVLKPNHGVSPAGVMAFCRQRLADFKVPSVVECVDALPKSRTGKILKRVLRAAVHTDSAARHEPAAHVVGPQDTPTRQAIEHWIVQWLAAQLACHPDTIAVGKPLAECGLTSLFAVHLAQQLGDWLGRSLAPVLVWQCPTAAALAQHLAMEQAPTGVAHSATGTEIARDEADLSRLAVDEVAALLDAEIRLAQQRKRQ